MKRTVMTIWICVAGMVLGASATSWAAPMGTVFTYQGRLTAEGVSAEGEYDFQFKLYDASFLGNQVGSTIKEENVEIEDGTFTVQLNFGGKGTFDGDARWLQIHVRTGELADPNTYTTLTPRQEVTPTPYALYAANAASDNDWMISGNDMYSIPTGNVGIGTTNPSAKLHVDGDIKIGYTDKYRVGLYPGLWWNSGSGSVAVGASNPVGLEIYSGSATPRLAIDKGSGNVGIGETNPSEKLDVDGHINSSQTYKLDGDTVLSNPGTDNIFVGKDAGASSTTGRWNTAMGDEALFSNTIGNDNTATGFFSLYSNTEGNQNSAVGSYALLSNTTGNDNSAVGYLALYSNTEGNQNSAMGTSALFSNTTGSSNSAMGYEALYSNISGMFNSAMGADALRSNTTGTSNSAVGANALSSNTGGNYNSAMGTSALFSNTTGSSNSAVGFGALYSNTGGQKNSAVGFEALSNNSTGSYNSAMGYYALHYNSTGDNNIAMGYEALKFNTEGFQNSAVGSGTLNDNTTGTSNSAMGYGALHDNTDGSSNLAMGALALTNNTNGFQNSAVGSGALMYNTSGYNNTAIGAGALNYTTTGSYNLAIGVSAGGNNGIGSRNVFIGNNAGFYETGSDKLYIANSSDDPPLIYGEFDNDKVGINTSSPNGTFEVSHDGSSTDLVVDSTTGSVRIGNEGTVDLANDNGDLYVEDDLEVDDDVLMAGLSWTAGGGYNLRWVNGELLYEISSAKYKDDIQPLNDDFHKIMKVKPKSYVDKVSGERSIGFIAEEFDEIGLDKLVIYRDGKPDALKYELVSLYLLEVVKEQVETTKELKAETERLKNQLTTENESLKQKLDSLERLVRKQQLSQRKEAL